MDGQTLSTPSAADARRGRAPATRADLEHLAKRVAVLGDAVAETRLVDVPADRPPWTDAGMDLQGGDRVTTFVGGRVWLSEELDLWLGADFQLWARVGAAGPVFRGTRASNTVTVEQAGRLELASYFPGEWTDRSGSIATPPEAYASVSGTLSALVIRWAPGTDPSGALRELVADDPLGLVRGELDRLAATVVVPDGWRHLWLLGESEIFSARTEAGTPPAGIACHTHRDAGILQYDVDVPLTQETRLHWSWRVDELPSLVGEDTLATHDYLSIALEFDNGQDLTWHWSADLPVDHSYRCPIPTWTDRETHVVVRSGLDDIGRWVHEERAVARDYADAVGLPPERIVRVWLIAVSLFQRRSGSCAFADIALHDGERTVRVTS